jgi:hypothetical protein
LERNPDGRNYRWSQAESTADIRNWRDTPESVVLSFFVAAQKTGKFTVTSGEQSASITVTGKPTHVEFPLSLKSNSSVKVRFVGEMGKIDLPPGETRNLHFYLMDFQLVAVPKI